MAYADRLRAIQDRHATFKKVVSIIVLASLITLPSIAYSPKVLSCCPLLWPPVLLFSVLPLNGPLGESFAINYFCPISISRWASILS